MNETLVRLIAALADRYRIERELGAGGMATVYLAEDLKHDRKVAIKVLHPDLAAALGAQRFLSEIKTTAALQHPHILPLHDSGEANGLLFYVMPYVEGESLRDRLNREKPLPIDDAVGIAREVASALDYAHRRGVIHRDIKPENILLHDRRALVADFGIALAVQSAGGERMTQTGLSLGTPHYMSPEQAMGEKQIDARSDVYALGAMLYEMLTGDPPFTGSTVQAVVAKVMSAEPEPVTMLRKSTPEPVAYAVHHALEKLPADRFATAAEFASALTTPRAAGATGAMGATTAGASRARSSRTLVIALSVATAAMAVITGWAWRHRAPAPVVSRYALALSPEGQAIANMFAIMTADGSRIIYVGPSDSLSTGQSQLWMKTRDQVEAAPIPGTVGVSAAALSPDDRQLLIVQGDTLRRASLDAMAGFVPVTANVGNAAGAVAWLDDGTLVYRAANEFSLMQMSAAGGPSKVVWTSKTVWPSEVMPLPGGRGVLFQGCVAPCNSSDLWALDLRTHEARIVAENSLVGFYLANGHVVYVTEQGGQAFAVPFDLRTLTVTGAPTPVMDGISLGSGTAPYFSVSRSGSVIMQAGTAANALRYSLAWIDQAGRETSIDSSAMYEVTRFAANHAWRLSPDGKRLAIGLHTSSGDDIWMRTLPRGPLSRLTFTASPDYRPRWTSDGRAVTYVAPGGLYLRRADGTGSDSLLWPGAFDEAALSPDRKWVVYRQGAAGPVSGRRDIFGVRLGGDSTPVPIVVTPFDEMAIELSPDGRHLAYQSDETGRVEVYVRPFPATNSAKAQVSSAGGTAPLWSRDGRTLYYLRGDQMMMAVPVTAAPALTVGVPRALFRMSKNMRLLGSSWYTPWDVAPDGRFIFLKAAGGSADLASPLIVIENWMVELNGKLKR